MKFNTQTSIGLFFLFWGVQSYFSQYSFISLFIRNETYHNFLPNYQLPLVWISLLFCTSYAYIEGYALRVSKHLLEPSLYPEMDSLQESMNSLDYVRIADDAPEDEGPNMAADAAMGEMGRNLN